MAGFFYNKRILVTGVCGTIGLALIKRLLDVKYCNPKEVIGLDNNENDIFFLDQKYSSDVRCTLFMADIRDKSEMINKMSSVDIVFHAAAMKHVIVSEKSPDQAVQTNIIGIQNIIHAAHVNNVERVIFTSSDKAVNPTNVMGTTKLMGERLITAANNKMNCNTIFASTRFGNVLGSNGSVIPIFQGQIMSGGPVTLTDSSMTRFVMSVEESIELIIDSALQAKGGEVFVTKMPVIRIKDLARVMVSVLAPLYGIQSNKIKIIEIGSKPGEKLYEELMSTEETRRTLELDKYFCILPAFRGVYSNIEYQYDGLINKNVTNPYISEDETPLSLDELKLFLDKGKLLEIMHSVQSGKKAIQ